VLEHAVPAIHRRSNASRMRRPTRPFLHPRLDLDRPELAVLDVLERDGHDLGLTVDRYVAEELQTEAGREIIALIFVAPLLEDGARPKSVVEPLRAPGAGMDRAGYEFPERLEILEHGRVGIVVMCGGVVHVSGDPYRVANAGVLEECEQVGDLDLTAARRAVALRDRVCAHHADRQIGGGPSTSPGSASIRV
jgi:hypothetical protein